MFTLIGGRVFGVFCFLFPIYFLLFPLLFAPSQQAETKLYYSMSNRNYIYNNSTPKHFESRDYYHRPGTHHKNHDRLATEQDNFNEYIVDQSAEKKKKEHFFTNLTSVNIATAFARAKITSDTIKRRPAHLKGTPMSPSQIPKMNLTDFPGNDNFGAHFEPTANPSVRPVRDILNHRNNRVSTNYRHRSVDAEPQPIEQRFGTAPYQSSYTQQQQQHQQPGDVTDNLPGSIIRQRNWDLPGNNNGSAPSWLKKAQDQRGINSNRRYPNINTVPPPQGITDSLPQHHRAYGSGGGGGGIQERMDFGDDVNAIDPLDDSLMDLKRASHLPARNARDTLNPEVAAARRYADEVLASNNAYDVGITTAAAAEDITNDAYTDGNLAGNRAMRRNALRKATSNASAALPSQNAFDRIRNSRASSIPPINNVNAALSGATPRNAFHRSKPTVAYDLDDDDDAENRAPRPTSRYSVRTRVSTPGHLDSYIRTDIGNGRFEATPEKQKQFNGVPTPYTAQIKGPGAFPATAQRFSQQRKGVRGPSNGLPGFLDDNDNIDLISPTAGRGPGGHLSRLASRHGGEDMLTGHPYLNRVRKPSAAANRGWDQYTNPDIQRGDRGSVNSFDDSFASNSSAGAHGLSSRGQDNPTLLKRLFSNIASGWTGSTGSVAERISFVFFMLYFLVKETFMVAGVFLFKLLVHLIVGPVFTGIRETLLLPASIWRLFSPSGGAHDAGRSMTGILTGLTVVAISIVANQLGLSALPGLASVPSIIPSGLNLGLWPFSSTSHKGSKGGGNGKRPPLAKFTPDTDFEPLTDEEIERLGGPDSPVVERLINVEQTLSHLYGLLDAVKAFREEEADDVRESLEQVQKERQSLLDAKRDDQRRINNLEREYGSLMRDVKAQAARGSDTARYAKELEDLKKHVDKLIKDDGNNGGGFWGKNKNKGATAEEVKRLINVAISKQERVMKEMLQPSWLTSDGDAAYANVARMIEDALSRYANDRLGRTDFALFSAGTRIIPGLTSPTYEPPAHGLSQKLWRKLGMVSSQPPAAILDPDIHVGECWPMRGSSGQIAIHLGQPVDIADFAIEHVAKSVAIDWRSAPRDIEVWGYVLDTNKTTTTATDSSSNGPSDAEATVGRKSATATTPLMEPAAATPSSSSPRPRSNGNGIANPPFADSKSKYGVGKLTLLATYEYKPSDTSALQLIRPNADIVNSNRRMMLKRKRVVKTANGHHHEDGSGIRIRTIILKVNSNWGHPGHTCLYRFRVHGHQTGS